MHVQNRHWFNLMGLSAVELATVQIIKVGRYGEEINPIAIAQNEK